MQRRLLQVSLLMMVSAVLASGLPTAVRAGGAGAEPWPTFRLELDVPAGVSPTILVETDGSGLYRFIQTGPSSYKVVNFDDGAIFALKPVGAGATAAMRVVYGGADGPDPMPTLGISWYVGGQPSTSVSLSEGESSSCSTCSQADIEWEE